MFRLLRGKVAACRSTSRLLPLLLSRLVLVEERLQRVLGVVELLLARCGQVLAGAIDIEREHRQRGTIGIGLAPVTPFGGAFQRGGDLLRIVELEDRSEERRVGKGCRTARSRGLVREA